MSLFCLFFVVVLLFCLFVLILMCPTTNISTLLIGINIHKIEVLCFAFVFVISITFFYKVPILTIELKDVGFEIDSRCSCHIS